VTPHKHPSITKRLRQDRRVDRALAKPVSEFDLTSVAETPLTACHHADIDLPPKFHPGAIRASAVFNTPNGAVGATGGNAKLSSCVALEPVAAMDPA